MIESRAIVALDVETAAQARALVAALGNAASFYKVGLELYTAAGMDFVRELKAEGRRVFLDLKMYDIGETVKRAVAQVAQTGVDFLTVHAMRPVMQAAVAGRGSSEPGQPHLNVLAVTVLTSFDDGDLKQMGYALGVRDLVELRVRQAVETGIDGIVCSPLEVARVRGLAPDSIIVTPGVRSAGAAAGDQKRVATPAEAIAAGADYVVVGRQVTRAKHPREEMLKIVEELKSAG